MFSPNQVEKIKDEAMSLSEFRTLNKVNVILAESLRDSLISKKAMDYIRNKMYDMKK